MNWLLIKIGFQSLLRNKLLFSLVLLSIAIGVAVTVGMNMAIESSNRAFENSMESLTGKSTHQIVGTDTGIHEDVYFSVRKITPWAAPVVELEAYVDGFGRKPFKILGLDPFLDAPFRSYFTDQFSLNQSFLDDLLLKKGSVLISQGLAKQLNVKQGESFETVINGIKQNLTVTLLLKPKKDADQRYLQDIILTDISSAQELSGDYQRISYIDLRIENNINKTIADIKAVLPPELSLISSSARSRTLEEMSKAFKLNMFALSLLGLLVGMFLIWSTVSFTILRRRREFSMLRAQGFFASQTFSLILIQALFIGVIGSLIGLGLGIFLGRFLVWIVSQTISDLFFVVHVNSVQISSKNLLQGFSLGILSSLLASLLPAIEVASIQPRQGFNKIAGNMLSKKWLLLMLLISLCFALISFLGLRFFTKSLAIALLSTLTVILSFSLWVPAVAYGLIACIKRLLSRITWQLGPLRLLSSLKRTAIPMAALMIALATVIGISGMIGSFRNTVVVWLDQQLTGDIYITVPNQGPSRKLVKLDPKIQKYLEAQSDVKRLDFLRASQLSTSRGLIQMVAFENQNFKSDNDFVDSVLPAAQVWENVSNGNGILVSEPLAYQWGMEKAGETVTIATPKGKREFKIIAIYYDYASSQGAISMSIKQFRNVWDDYSINGIAAHLKNSSSAERLSAQWMRDLQSIQSLDIKPNTVIRKEVFDIFDRTFTITEALKWLAVFVAFVGIISSLLSQVIENLNEYGLLRALGFKREEISLQILIESMCLGLISWLIALPLGYLLAYMMVYIINYRAFGWTLQLSLPPSLAVQTLFLAIFASALAAIYPSIKIFKLKPMDILRTDT